ncbi:signal peptide peptidase SppA, 36K type [mine drainage metagenome]|uniref:Signal peptide peptidase SppA, 36K type n=1 Tax=mine drainage metagenome TaxID=410659 RepID=T0YA13_9ZZZZ
MGEAEKCDAEGGRAEGCRLATRDLTPAEQAYFQGLIDNMHTQFIHDVAVGRRLPVQDIQTLATGQVWTGQQALGLHLIDQAGGFRVALLDTARAVGIKGEPEIVRPHEPHPGLVDLVLGADSKLAFRIRRSCSPCWRKAPDFIFCGNKLLRYRCANPATHPIL